MRRPFFRTWYVAIVICTCLTSLASLARAAGELARVEPVKVEQIGKVPEGAAQPNTVVLANEPEGGSAGIALEFDFESLPQKLTPLARVQLIDVTKLQVSRPGQQASIGRGALHAFVRGGGGSGSEAPQLVGSCAVKPAGIALPYTADITDAVSAALAKPAGQRTLRVELRVTGAPAYYEVYGLTTGMGKKSAVLEIAPADNWSNDWQQRVAPITAGPLVYREACMPIVEKAGELELKLLYPAKKVVEVIHNGTGEKLEEGRDWVLRDGKVILPPGSHAPVQIESEFFARPPSTAPSTAPASSKPAALLAVQLKEGTYYHERQIEVTYEPAQRDWSFPPPLSSPDQLPRVHKLLAEKKPVRVVLFGDSITWGGNASKVQGCWPYQPQYGELAMWAVQKHYGGPMEVMNHGRGGATTSWAKGQAETQVAAFKPDLAIIAYGMNDRADARRATFRQDMEELIDTIRKGSPETELILVTSMLNNPKQPAGNGPILSIRDEALKIQRPGLAHVDMTTTHLELIKRKNYLDTSGNGANHPNDYLHRIYAMRVMEVLMPSRAR